MPLPHKESNETKVEKAFGVLKKQLTVWEMISLIGLLSEEASKATSDDFVEQL